MSDKTLKHLRVVVHLDEQDPEDQDASVHNINSERKVGFCFENNIKKQVVGSSGQRPLNHSPEFDNMKAEILLINEKSLQLNLISTEEDDIPHTNISHKMHFDRVSYSTYDIIKCEFAIVMDVLLLKRKNSCIMRFASKQEMSINTYFELLITFLNKRLYHQKYKLQYVKLECLEVATSLRNSRRDGFEKGYAMRANLVDDYDDNNNNNASYRYPKYAKNQFRSTRGLLLWLVNEYRFKFADNNGHEKLQFSFSIADHQQNVFKVKLSLFNIFLNLMDNEDRNHWHFYMDHVGEGCEGLDCNFVHSGLTINMSYYLEDEANEITLLFFDIPTNIKMTADTTDMLQMAHSVIKNRKRKLLLLRTKADRDRYLQSSKNCFKCRSPQQREELKDKKATIGKNIRRPSLPLFLEPQSMEATLCDVTYSNTDFNTLNFWYKKIDECFEKNNELREKYFCSYFKFSNKKIFTNITNMFKSIEPLHIQQLVRDQTELKKDQIELQKIFESYDDIREEFGQISEDIKNTGFEDILNVYLEAKTYDLNNQAQNSVINHLKLCQQKINSTFDNLFSKRKLELDC